MYIREVTTLFFCTPITRLGKYLPKIIGPRNKVIVASEMNISNTIQESNKGNVKIIRFNKPKRKNAIDTEMYARVTQILNEAAIDQDTQMVVLTGTGFFYSSGNDLTAVKHEDTNEFLKVLGDFIKAFILFPKLLTVIVNGPAVGIATTTLPLCDFVFASDKAYFYTPFTKLGIIPEACSTVTFPRLIGAKKATQLLLLNYKMQAQEALECGLIDYVYKFDELEEKAWNKINEILALPIDSLLITKRLFRRPHLDELLKVNEIEMAETCRIVAKRLSKL